MEREKDEIGVLWEKTGKNGARYYSGYVGDQKVVVFRTKKKDGSNQPDLRILKAIAPQKQESEYSEDIPF
jgi:uncharacterized protein (DUF736 family)